MGQNRKQKVPKFFFFLKKNQYKAYLNFYAKKEINII